jgi:Asp-tRNA(Asn)/Glu-tRNA(Gln) amidotransferase A subunit family amidase
LAAGNVANAEAVTIPFNLHGLPSLSLLRGFTQSGLPIGLQITGPRLGESNGLALAQVYKRSMDWHLKRSALS